MKRRWHGIIAIALLIFLLSTVAVSCAEETPTDAIGTVKVGMNVAATGPWSSATLPAGIGVRSYLRYVNDEFGGIKYKDPVTGKT